LKDCAAFNAAGSACERGSAWEKVLGLLMWLIQGTLSPSMAQPGF